MTTRTAWHASRLTSLTWTASDVAIGALFLMGIAGWGIVGIRVISWLGDFVAEWIWR